METNKFEKHIAEKMKERKIQPSPDAWERISGRLEVSEAPKRKGYFWYGIAASIIGLLIVSIVVLNQESTSDAPVIVDAPKTDEENNLKKDLPIIESKDATEMVLEQETKNGSKDQNKVQTIVEEQELAVNETKEKLNATSNELGDETLSNKNTDGLVISEAVVEAKITELLAQADVLEANNTSLTDAEVDSLLRKAQQEIVAQRIIDDSGSVNAMALLSEVEDELDQSFRDQIFDQLKSGFLKVRTAVADRNN